MSADDRARRRVFMACVLCLVATLGACGGSDDAPVAPTFTAQPADVAVIEPARAEFVVEVTGTPLPQLQWQVSSDAGSSWSDVPAAQALAHTIDPTSTAFDGHRYRAVAVNGAGTSISHAATLAVSSVPRITRQPVDIRTSEPGLRTDFSLEFTGTPAPGVQWQVSRDAGATWAEFKPVSYPPVGRSDIRIDFVTLQMNGNQYRAVVFNAAGTTTSSAATLTVTRLPYFEMWPDNVSVAAPLEATFCVVAAGSPKPALQWQLSTDGGVSWVDLPAATESRYTIAPTQIGFSGQQYRVVASNLVASIASTAATLTVTPPTMIGPAGGTVTGADGSQAIIPAGALWSPAEIAIGRQRFTTPVFPPTSFQAIGLVYAFTPHGIHFDLPVMVRVPFKPTLAWPEDGPPRLMRAQTGGIFVEVPDAAVDGNFMVATLSGFSLLGVVQLKTDTTPTITSYCP